MSLFFLYSLYVLRCWFSENMHIIKHFNLSFESSVYLKGTSPVRKGFAQEASLSPTVRSDQTKSTKLRILYEKALLILFPIYNPSFISRTACTEHC